MTERMRDDELETTLVEIGERLSYPQPTQLASAVRARLREPRARRTFWTAPAFAPTFVTIGLLLLVVAIGFPGLLTNAREFLHLRGIDIFPVPSVASIAPSLPVAVPGDRTTLDEGRGEQVYSGLLTTLDVYTRTHFGFEEKCMERYHCPFAEKNKDALSEPAPTAATANDAQSNPP